MSAGATSAQTLSVSKSLEECLNTLSVYSGTFYEAARAGYIHHGRGSLVSMFPNIDALGDYNEGTAWQYLPREVLAELDYPEVMDLMSMYDPDTQFVALASNDIKTPRVDKFNAVMLCKMIGKDVELVTEPDREADGRVSHGWTVAGEDMTDAERTRNVLKCAASGCNATEGLRVCAGCRDARYCSKDCQFSHRAQHKEACKTLKAAKDEAKEFLRILEAANDSSRRST
jgi:MYND finger